VDISAVTFTASWATPGGKPTTPVRLAQGPAGFAALQQRLQAAGVAPAATRVVVEATSSYWVALAAALREAGYRVFAINPAQAHSFAQARLRRAETDALDAPGTRLRVLARLADQLDLSPRTPPPTIYHELRQRLLAREAPISLRQRARDQRHALVQWPVEVASAQRQLDEVIEDLDERIGAVEHELGLVVANGAGAASAAFLTSAPGIGTIAAA
jgi:transposase